MSFIYRDRLIRGLTPFPVRPFSSRFVTDNFQKKKKVTIASKIGLK